MFASKERTLSKTDTVSLRNDPHDVAKQHAPQLEQLEQHRALG